MESLQKIQVYLPNTTQGLKETYFVWKKDKTLEHHTTIRNKATNDIVIKLPK